MTPEQLDDAKAKYHLLATGQAARVVVDGMSGDRVEYQGAKVSELLAYIRMFDPGFGATPIMARVSRPFKFIF